MPNPTTNFSWTKPTEDGSTGVWDTILNDMFDAVDSDLNSVKTTADAAMPKAGGTFTGNIKAKTVTAAVQNMGSVGSALNSTDGYDLANANYFSATLNANCTVAAPANIPSSGTLASWVLEITNSGSFTLGWNLAYDWPGGIAPNPTENGTDVYVCWTRDGGTNIFAVKIAEDVS